MKKYFIGLFVYLLICLFPPLANGEVMSSDGYTVENNNIEIGQYKPKPLPTTTPVPEKFYATGDNYTIQTTAPEAFSFATSHDEVNFGKLTATNPVIRLLYLTTNSKLPYQIMVGENRRLGDGAKSIPDTTCDNGSCTTQTSAIWTSTLTYGFGYQTKDLPDDNYQSFADWSQNKTLEPVFTHEIGENTQDQITFKVNIPATQQAGQYTNVVSFIAMPDF